MPTPHQSTPTNGYTDLVQLWNSLTVLPKDEQDSLANLAWGFWHAGNTLDTFMDYLERAKPNDFKKTAADLANQSIEVFRRAVGVDLMSPPAMPPTVAWWDDYGWWGLAFLKVHMLTNASKYLQCAETCWDFMDKGGRHHNGGNSAENNGTWNHYPGGNQNLITNALFLNLSAQLYNLTTVERYLTGACAQFRWFYHWFTLGALCSVKPRGTLVYPSTKYPVSVNVASIENSKGKYWTGDQGAVIGALNSLHRVADAAASKITEPSALGDYLINTCDSIVQAVTSHETMVYQNSDVLYEPDWFDLNGAVGKGVLMRYLVAWLEYQGTVTKYAKFIGDNALAATTHPEEDGYFRFSWANVPRHSISDGGLGLQQLTRQCAGQDAFNANLLVDASS